MDAESIHELALKQVPFTVCVLDAVSVNAAVVLRRWVRAFRRCPEGVEYAETTLIIVSPLNVLLIIVVLKLHAHVISVQPSYFRV
jgi:hypothetical protein